MPVRSTWTTGTRRHPKRRTIGPHRRPKRRSPLRSPSTGSTSRPGCRAKAEGLEHLGRVEDLKLDQRYRLERNEDAPRSVMRKDEGLAGRARR